jgi:hypothetical protein
MAGELSAEDCMDSPRGLGFLAEEYLIPLQAGIPLRVISEWNGADGYLYLTGPDGRILAENDDDPTSDRNRALLEFIPEHSGEFTIWPTTFARNEQGSFDLAVDCGSAPSPDLITSATLVSESSVDVGDLATVRYTINNQGNAPVEDAEVRMYLSSDEVISPQDRLLDSEQIGSLAAGESVTRDLVVEVPAEPGDYWIGPCAMAVTGESITGNNCVLSQPESQLQADGGGWEPLSTNEAGGGLLVRVSSGASCSARQLSCGQAVGGSLQPDDCDRGPRGSGYLADLFSFNGNAGDIVTLGVTWTGLDGYLYLEDANGRILAENDDFQGAGDSRIEIEMPSSSSYTVWPSAFDQGIAATGAYEISLMCNDPVAPDLSLSEPTVSYDTLRRGQALAISTTVRNIGGSDSEATQLIYYLALDQTLSENDRFIGSIDLQALEKGARTATSFEVPIDAGPGSYFLTVCADIDSKEVDVANNCASTGPVVIEESLEQIPITTGLNDAWYNPVTDGQGFFINVFPDTRLMFLSWFTYDVERPPSDVAAELGDPGHRWLTAQGNYERGVATLNVTLTRGGTFDSPTPPVSNDAEYGTMTVSFSDCNNGVIEYELPEIDDKGTIPITRVNADNVAACEEQIGAPGETGAGLQAVQRLESGNLIGKQSVLQSEMETGASSSFEYNRFLNDAWFNPETDGQGFFFNVFPHIGVTFLGWFTYEVERPPAGTPFMLGEPGHRWLTAQGGFEGDTAELTVYETIGGEFNQTSPVPVNTPIGTVTATFENCNSGVVDYNLASIERSGSIPIERITRDSIPTCEQEILSGQSAESIQPADREVLENACNGPVTWDFDWPEEDADTYVFVLWRNDTVRSNAETYETRIVSESALQLVKDTPISDAHLEGWEWSYAPLHAAKAGEGSGGVDRDMLMAALEGRESRSFSVRPQSDPCID